MVQLRFITMGLQSVYPVNCSITIHQGNAGVGIGFPALQAMPHRIFFLVGHVIPLFCADELSLRVEEQSSFINDGVWNFSTKGNICPDSKMREEGPHEYGLVQERFITEGNTDTLCIGFRDGGQRHF